MLIDFLTDVLPNHGPYSWSVGAADVRSATNMARLEAGISAHATGTSDIYFVPAQTNGGRKTADFQARRCLVLDIDIKTDNPNNYASQTDAFADLIKMCDAVFVRPTWVVNSGGGLHVYWCIDQTVTKADMYSVLGRALVQLIQSSDYPKLAADPAPSYNPVGLLRPINTTNHKHGTQRPVKGSKIGKVLDVRRVLEKLQPHISQPTRTSTNTNTSTSGAPTIVAVQPGYGTVVSMAATMSPELPTPAENVAYHCRIVRHYADPANQANTPEPIWYAMAMLFARDGDADKGWEVFKAASMHDPRYTEQEATQKFERARKEMSNSSSAVTCDHLVSLCGTNSHCAGCPMLGKGSPLYSRNLPPPVKAYTQLHSVEGVTFEYATVTPPTHLSSGVGFNENAAGVLVFSSAAKTHKTTGTVIPAEDTTITKSTFWAVSSGATKAGEEHQHRFARRSRVGVSGSFETFDLTVEETTSEQQVITALSRRGIHTTEKALILKYLCAEKDRMSHVKAETLVEQPGWGMDRVTGTRYFSLGMFTVSATAVKTDAMVAKEVRDIGFGPQSKNTNEPFNHQTNCLGSERDFLDNVAAPILAGDGEQFMPFLIALGAPAAMLFEDTPASRVILSGKTSARKTTLLKAINACYAKTDNTFSKVNRDTSAAGRSALFRKYNNLPMCTDDLTLNKNDLEEVAREVLNEGAGDSNKANRNSTARAQKSASVMRFLSTNRDVQQDILNGAKSDEQTVDAAIARITQFTYNSNNPAIPHMDNPRLIAYDKAIAESSGWIGLGFLSWLLSSQNGTYILNNKESVRTMICNACGGDTERRFRNSQFFGAWCAAVFLKERGLADVSGKIKTFYERTKVQDEVLRDQRKKMKDAGTPFYLWCTAPSVHHFPEAKLTGKNITMNTMGLGTGQKTFGFRVEGLGVFLEAGQETAAQLVAGTRQTLHRKHLFELLPEYTLTIDGKTIPPSTPYIKVT